MKFELFVLALCLCGALSDEQVGQADRPTEANLNAYMDYLLIQVGPKMKQLGWVPMPLPDIEDEFEAKPIFITYRGTISMWNGMLNDFAGTYRVGTSMMYYDQKLLRVDTSVNMRNLEWRYDYLAHIWEFGPDGWISGYVKEFVFAIDIIIDISDFYFYLNDFRVDYMNGINVTFHGSILVDWLLDALSDVVVLIFKTTITDAISATVKANVQGVIDQMNANRHNSSNVAELPKLMDELMRNIGVQEFRAKA